MAQIKLGILVPSSNTSLEPLTTSLLSSIPNTSVSVHFSRFPVTHIALSATALSQFNEPAILAAAQLLADAEVDVIGWSGTSSGWLGFEADEKLCASIEEATGIRATTSVLALNKLLEIVRRKDEGMRFGLVTPYLDDVQEAIVGTYAKAGFKIAAESHLNKTINVEFARVSEDTLENQMEEVVAQLGTGTKVVSTFCTNLRAAQRAEHWEAKYDGLYIFDTTATVVWDMLRMTGVDGSRVKGWGKMFEMN
jgi:maleate isomerase